MLISKKYNFWIENQNLHEPVCIYTLSNVFIGWPFQWIFSWPMFWFAKYCCCPWIGFIMTGCWAFEILSTSILNLLKSYTNVQTKRIELITIRYSVLFFQSMANCPVKISTAKNIPKPCAMDVILFKVHEVYPMKSGVCYLIFLSWFIIKWMANVIKIPAKKTPVFANG